MSADAPFPQEVSPHEAAGLAAAGAALIDVRERAEWDAGRIAGAVWLPMSELPARLDELPAGDLVIVCRSGARSGAVSTALIQTGRRAANLTGGMLAWTAAGLPIEPAGGHVA
jgi:rhodanese-related sulfurtransferase